MQPELPLPAVADTILGPGAVLLRGFAFSTAADLAGAIGLIETRSPFRHLITPGGRRMSVAMTNCGPLGWVSDRGGYRYEAIDPETARPWHVMPDGFMDLARRAALQAGYPGFVPDACLINRYAPGVRLTLHRDSDEDGVEAPIVSVSLGVPATFLWGGMQRTDRVRRIRVEHGDVAVWGGPSRLAFHGVDTLRLGTHALTGAFRLNLTFRRARRAAGPSG